MPGKPGKADVTRWLPWIAVLFCCYSIALLWYAHSAQNTLRQSIDARLIRESQRRADTFTAYIDDRCNEVREIVERYEIESYFINAALGMSQRYGLLANLVAIDDYFARKRTQRKVMGIPVFDQIILYDEHGLALSDGAPEQHPTPLPLSQHLAEVAVKIDVDNKRLIIAAPVKFKGRYRGAVVTTSDLSQISTILFGSNIGRRYQEFLTDGNGAILTHVDVPRWVDKSAAVALSQLPANFVLKISGKGEGADKTRGTQWVIRSVVDSTPLSLITLIQQEDVYGPLESKFILITLGIFPFLLVLATMAFQHQRSQSLALQTDNRLLADEITRREELEVALQCNNEKLQALTADLQLTVNRAEEASRAKSDFLAMMSHEIRTPMNGILGMAQLLQSENLPESERLDSIRIINESGNTLLTLLNDILDLSKVEAGKFELRPAECRPAILLRDCMQLYAEAARARKLALVIGTSQPDTLCIAADGTRLRQMLGNLISNALKFTERGEIEVSLTETASYGDAVELEFSVRDTGIGIDNNKLDSLFEPFTQVDSSTTRQFGGTGLGLAIVHRMAQLMGGNTGVESIPGKGSRFWFRIHAKRLEKQSPSIAIESPPSSEINVKFSGTVMVADDNLLNRRVIQLALTKMGLKVIEAENGLQAVEHFSGKQGVDLILMDICMPEMGGIEATGLIRQLQSANSGCRCPIIAFTANAYDDDRQHCLDAGMDDFLVKPIKIDELRRVIEHWLPLADSRSVSESGATPIPVNIGQVTELLASLLPLLDQHLFDGVELFQALRKSLGGTSAETACEEICTDLARLDFDAVACKLRALAKREGWPLEPPARSMT